MSIEAISSISAIRPAALGESTPKQDTSAPPNNNVNPEQDRAEFSEAGLRTAAQEEESSRAQNTEKPRAAQEDPPPPPSRSEAPAPPPETEGTSDRKPEESSEAETTEVSSDEEELGPGELTEEEQEMVEELKARDVEVRQHEQAHLTAAGDLAIGGAKYDYQRGPDGKRYAVGGSVNIDVSEVPNDPEATKTKADRIKRAALAPAEPSGKDRQVAAQADRMKARAQQEISANLAEEAAPDFEKTETKPVENPFEQQETQSSAETIAGTPPTAPQSPAANNRPPELSESRGSIDVPGLGGSSGSAAPQASISPGVTTLNSTGESRAPSARGAAPVASGVLAYNQNQNPLQKAAQSGLSFIA